MPTADVSTSDMLPVGVAVGIGRRGLQDLWKSSGMNVPISSSLKRSKRTVKKLAEIRETAASLELACSRVDGSLRNAADEDLLDLQFYPAEQYLTVVEAMRSLRGSMAASKWPLTKETQSVRTAVVAYANAADGGVSLLLNHPDMQELQSDWETFNDRLEQFRTVVLRRRMVG